MQNRKIICLLVLLGLLSSPIAYIAKSNTTWSNQEPSIKLFLALIRGGYDMIEDDQTFAQICHLLNGILVKEKKGELMMTVNNSTLITNNSISGIDWEIIYDDFIALISARSILCIDIGENNEIKIEGVTTSISDLQNLAREYIFYPDSIHRKLTIRNSCIEGIGEVETSLVTPILNLHLPKEKNLSISDWRFFFYCLRELIELYDDERNKASFRIFNKSYFSLSLEDREKISQVIGYNIRIEIIR